jgi:UDP-N-acetylmuramoyl-tripeptide--D-alanyl-D-alanine ligase
MRAASGPYVAERIAAACNGRLLCGDPGTAFDAISTDSRDINERDLFVPIVGETYDGHDFLLPALEAGALGSLVAREINREILKNLASFVLIQVQDTLQALSDLASTHRIIYPTPLIAVTGSSGKTTVKEMIATVLGRSHRPLVSEGNFNNVIGLPMTVLKLAREHTVAVVEAGINMNGEMERLAHAASPDVAVITTIGAVHLEGLGTVDNVAREKFRLVEALPQEGIAVLPADDPHLEPLLDLTSADIVDFGLTSGAFRSENIRENPELNYDMISPHGSMEIRLGTRGIHNVTNSLAAAAACLAVGSSLSDVVEGLAAFTPPSMRMEIVPLPGNRTLIRDCYNANPQSVMAALKTLAAYGNEGRTLAVLGDMKELGEQAVRLHHEIGREAAMLGIDQLVFIGDFRKSFADGYLDGRGDSSRLILAADREQAWHEIEDGLGGYGTILVKGSRAMRMEIIADKMLEVN